MQAFTVPEADMLRAIPAVGLPEPVHQHRFHPTRKWVFDFAYLRQKIAVECDGGTWSKGRHVRGQGFEDDCVKLNEAALLGWLVLRFTTEMITDGRAVEFVERALREVE